MLCDADERRNLIAEQVSALAGPSESVALADDLLDEVAGLVNGPLLCAAVLMSGF